MDQPNNFFEVNGDKQLAEVPMTFNQLYAVFKQRQDQESYEQLKKDWPALGTQP